MASSIVPAMPPQVLHTDPETGAETVHRLLRVDRGMSYAAAAAALCDHIQSAQVSMPTAATDASVTDPDIRSKRVRACQ